MKNTLTLLVLALVFALQSNVSKAENKVQTRDLQKILAATQVEYDKIQDFSANFKQIYHHKVLKLEPSLGNVIFKKPGLMRWNYLKPSKKSFIVDGKALWIYQPDDNLAMVDRCFKQDTLTASLSFLWGGGNIRKQFDAQFFDGSFGEKSDIHIKLTPKTKTNFFKRVILVIDEKTHKVKQSIVVDLEGNLNQFIFSEIRYQTKTNEKEFRFEPPKNVHVSAMPGSVDKCK